MQLKNDYSYWLIIFFSFVLILFRIISPPTNILSWDVFGYYLYLPAKFIYHNLSLTDQSWLTELIKKYEPTSTLYQAILLPNGNWAMKYSMGLSIFYSPFFFIGHLIASLCGYPTDGLSLPYQYSMAGGGVIFAIIGLFYFRKILKHFFNERITIILLIIIFTATNYFQLTVFDGTLLSHNFLFTLYAILIWYTIQWHEKSTIKSALMIGVLSGFIILIRPSEIVCLLIPIFWNIYNKDSLQKKYKLLQKYFSHIIILGIALFVVILPQLIYWKIISGHFIFYSYTNPGEGFDFKCPHTLKFLFSFRKGWLIYTPVMIFALIGFYHLHKKQRNIFPAILIFFIISIYVISSWSCWWYAGGSYSSRSLVPAYILLALPLGYFVQELLKKKLLPIIFGVIGIFMIFLNLFQTWQFEKDIISRESMTMKYYFAIFGKTSVSEEDKKLRLVERSSEAIEHFTNKENYNKRTLCSYDFENIQDTRLICHIGKGSMRLNGQSPYSVGPNIMFKDLTSKDHAWIRASVWIYIPETYSEELPALILTFHHKGQTYKYRGIDMLKEHTRKGQWNYLTVDYLTPEVRSEEDNMKVYVWQKGQETVFVDDFIVDVYEPK
ncbi:MAG: glycosyltransferase family 39 protein [Bacteroidetes bacterium]|nr:glycosyltransferase family 39 protein [Bacteroidota bacterium]